LKREPEGLHDAVLIRNLSDERTQTGTANFFSRKKPTGKFVLRMREIGCEWGCCWAELCDELTLTVVILSVGSVQE